MRACFQLGAHRRQEGGLQAHVSSSLQISFPNKKYSLHDSWEQACQLSSRGVCPLQALLLNHSRQRRRLRRGLEDWANLYQHAANADSNRDFMRQLKALSWTWRYKDASGEEMQVTEVDRQPTAKSFRIATCKCFMFHV